MGLILLEPMLPSTVFLKMFTDDAHKNVQITTAEGAVISSHSAVLGAVSSKLGAIFSSCPHGVFRLSTPDIPTVHWQVILQMIHTGRVELSTSDIAAVHVLIDSCTKLEMSQLVTMLARYRDGTKIVVNLVSPTAMGEVASRRRDSHSEHTGSEEKEGFDDKENNNNSVQKEKEGSVECFQKESVGDVPKERECSVQEEKEASVEREKESCVEKVREGSVQKEKECFVEKERNRFAGKDMEGSVEKERGDMEGSVQKDKEGSGEKLREGCVEKEKEAFVEKGTKVFVRKDKEGSVEKERTESLQKERKRSVEKDKEGSVEKLRDGSIHKEITESVQQESDSQILVENSTTEGVEMSVQHQQVKNRLMQKRDSKRSDSFTFLKSCLFPAYENTQTSDVAANNMYVENVVGSENEVNGQEKDDKMARATDDGGAIVDEDGSIIIVDDDSNDSCDLANDESDKVNSQHDDGDIVIIDKDPNDTCEEVEKRSGSCAENNKLIAAILNSPCSASSKSPDAEKASLRDMRVLGELKLHIPEHSESIAAATLTNANLRVNDCNSDANSSMITSTESVRERCKRKTLPDEQSPPNCGNRLPKRSKSCDPNIVVCEKSDDVSLMAEDSCMPMVISANDNEEAPPHVIEIKPLDNDETPFRNVQDDLNPDSETNLSNGSAVEPIGMIVKSEYSSRNAARPYNNDFIVIEDDEELEIGHNRNKGTTLYESKDAIESNGNTKQKQSDYLHVEGGVDLPFGRDVISGKPKEKDGNFHNGSFNQDVASKKKLSTASYKCTPCKKVFSDSEELLRHLTWLCPLECRSEPNLDVSCVPKQLGERFYLMSLKCERCTYVARNQTGIAHHMKHSHKTVDCFICYWCHKGFSLWKVLRMHVNICHGFDGDILGNRIKLKNKRKFASRAAIKALKEDASLEAIAERNNYDVACKEKNTNSSLDDQGSDLSHEPSQKCPSPKKRVSSKLKHDMVDRTCKYCGHVSNTNTEAGKHLLDVHNLRKCHVCKWCGSSYSHYVSLSIHFRSKCSKCSKCNCSLKEPYNRNRDMVEKKCRLCGNVSKSNAEAGRHMLHVHKMQRCYMCRICGKCYEHYPVLARHFHSVCNRMCARCGSQETKVNGLDGVRISNNIKEEETKDSSEVTGFCGDEVKSNVGKDCALTEMKSGPETSETKADFIRCKCGRVFTHYSIYKLHARFWCRDAKLKYVERKGRDRNAGETDDENPYIIPLKCRLCDTLCMSFLEATKHARLVHGLRKCYLCKRCGKGFKELSNLRVHYEKRCPKLVEETE